MLSADLEVKIARARVAGMVRAVAAAENRAAVARARGKVPAAAAAEEEAQVLRAELEQLAGAVLQAEVRDLVEPDLPDPVGVAAHVGALALAVAVAAQDPGPAAVPGVAGGVGGEGPGEVLGQGRHLARGGGAAGAGEEPQRGHGEGPVEDRPPPRRRQAPEHVEMLLAAEPRGRV